MKPYHIWREWFKISNDDLEAIRLYALSLCKGLHFRNDPCIVRKSAGVAQRIERHEPDEGHEDAGSTPAPSPFKRGPGRPKTITDMRAYKANWQTKYRAEVAAGIRIPKRRDDK